MSVKNPLAELTEKHGLKRCSMGRCCNVENYAKLKKIAKFYADLKIEGYPNLGDMARRLLEEVESET